MNYIGNVIKQYRSMIGMSRKELAADVCSDKYLYMIEKGKRTPSTEITRLLGDKMGADLFQYYEYLDCADPIGVSAYIDQFNRCRRGNSYKLLAEITEKASKTEDFKKDPWQYEIQLNRFTIQVISKGESIQAIPYIQNIIEEMEQKKLKNICYVYFLVLLSTCYLMQGDLKNARKLVSFISDATKRKQSITKYAQAIVVAKSNKISMHYLAGELDLVIEESLKLNEYQNEVYYKEYLHQGFFYLAFAYYQKGQEEEGIRWFEKALSIVLISQKTIDMFYMKSFEIFDVIMQDKRLSQDLVKKVKAQYSKLKI